LAASRTISGLICKYSIKRDEKRFVVVCGGVWCIDGLLDTWLKGERQLNVARLLGVVHDLEAARTTWLACGYGRQVLNYVLPELDDNQHRRSSASRMLIDLCT
jgi:hypothetical protein